MAPELHPQRSESLLGVGRPRKKKKQASRRQGRNECLKSVKISVRKSDPQLVGEEYVPPMVNNFPKPNGLVKFKISEYGVQNIRSAKIERAVPFIDRRGCIHSDPICYWKCSGPQLMNTIAATILKRLVGANWKKRDRKSRVSIDILSRISLLYAISLDSYWFSRTLEILKRGPKGLQKHVYRKQKQVDTNKRFLFDQMFLNISWLQSRAYRPRAISTLVTRHKTPSDKHRQQVAIDCLGAQCVINQAMFLWSSRMTPPLESIRSTVNSRLGRQSLLLFEGNPVQDTVR